VNGPDDDQAVAANESAILSSRRVVAVGVAVALLLPAAGFALARQSDEVIPIAVGDVVKLTGAPLGCAARFQNGIRAVDCRKIGTLRGTYGTILTARQVLVVRFEDRRSARIVFSAHHQRRGVQTCHTSP